MAEPIGEKRARQIAEEFFAAHATRSAYGDITLEWAGDSIDTDMTSGSDLNNSLMYIYNRGNNEGFVIIAGDSNLDPIIAYSFDTSNDTDDMAEATSLLLEAWCRKVQHVRQTAKPISGDATRAATRNSDELLYETAIWNQNAPFNNEAPVIDGYRAVTGCVATAMSIICYYNKWPQNGVGTTPAYTYTHYTGTTTVPANTLGRTYNYDDMLMNYNNGYSTTEGNAVAALMKDMGTATKMAYHYNGSGTYDSEAIYALTTYFGYSKSATLDYADSYSTDEWNSIIRKNVRTYGPTYFSGGSDSGGHAFVIDGFAPNNYFHFNFGWGGQGNGYFLIPEIEYYQQQCAILYLEPDPDSTSQYRDNLKLYPQLLSTGYQCKGLDSDALYYRQGESFNITIGAICNLGQATYSGNVALMHCDANGNIKDILNTWEINLDPYYVMRLPASVTINKSVETGDRLRMYYMQSVTGEWEWMRSYTIAPDTPVYTELLMSGSAEDVADTLMLAFDNTEHLIIFNSPYPLQIVITTENSTEALIDGYGYANTTYSIEIGESPGVLIFHFSSGNDPYSVKIKR